MGWFQRSRQGQIQSTRFLICVHFGNIFSLKETTTLGFERTSLKIAEEPPPHSNEPWVANLKPQRIYESKMAIKWMIPNHDGMKGCFIKHCPNKNGTNFKVPRHGFKRNHSDPYGCWTKNRGGPPKSSHFNRVFHYKPSIFGGPPLFLGTIIYPKRWFVPATCESPEICSYLVLSRGQEWKT